MRKPGAAAWIAQNLSCGYYLLFFTPVLALYLAWELTRRRLWTDRSVVIRMASAAVRRFGTSLNRSLKISSESGPA